MTHGIVAPCLAGLLSTAFVLLATPALAVGPHTPVRFDTDPEQDPWTLTLLTDERHRSALRIEVHVYQDGEPVSRRELKLSRRQFARSDRDDTLSARLSLKSDELAKLKPGIYAQKAIVTVDRQDAPSLRPMRIQRWQYFIVKDYGVYPISMARYSALTDPSQMMIGHDGREEPVHIGRAEKLEVSLEKTERSEAIPLGRQSGLRQELIRDDPRKAQGFRQQAETGRDVDPNVEDERDEK